MQDTLNAISYVGGLIFGLVFVFSIVIGMFALLISLIVDRMERKLVIDIAEAEGEFDDYR